MNKTFNEIITEKFFEQLALIESKSFSNETISSYDLGELTFSNLTFLDCNFIDIHFFKSELQNCDFENSGFFKSALSAIGLMTLIWQEWILQNVSLLNQSLSK
jgi:uncharacterized protein YjbI with pentapeptide repeats